MHFVLFEWSKFVHSCSCRCLSIPLWVAKRMSKLNHNFEGFVQGIIGTEDENYTEQIQECGLKFYHKLNRVNSFPILNKISLKTKQRRQ